MAFLHQAYKKQKWFLCVYYVLCCAISITVVKAEVQEICLNNELLLSQTAV